MRNSTTSRPQDDADADTDDNGASNPFARSASRLGKSPAKSVRASSRESSKENMAPPDAEEYETQRRRIEELKAEVAAMRYKCETHEQEKEIISLQHEKELRDKDRKAEEDFKQRQTAEGEKAQAERQVAAIMAELHELKDKSENDTNALEKRLRDSEQEARKLQEQLEDLSDAKEESERVNQKRVVELETQIASVRQTTEELDQLRKAREEALQQAQDQLAAKNTVIGELEAEVLRLKAQTGDADTISVIRRELSDQVQHIRTVEASNSKLQAEVTHYRQIHKAVEVVEEEKRTLQRKLEAASALETELSEARLQRQRLEDERLAWTAYLESANRDGDAMDLEFDSPEAVARALVQERYNVASLVEKLGAIEPEIREREEMIKTLENDKIELHAQIEKLKSAPPALPADKMQARLERQRLLAVKEAEYLRAQLKNYDAEDETFEPEKVDHQKLERIAELEKLVDQYKTEVQTLQKELSSVEKPPASAAPAAVAVGSKRSHEADAADAERVGELNRKRRKLEAELAEKTKALELAHTETKVLKSRLRAAEASNKTRVLSLRSNPTSDFEAVKTATLAALKQENKQLLAQVEKAHKNPPFPVIPASQLAAARREIEEAKKETASAQKSARRLKEVWGAKSHEFKEAIFSTLGWTVTFIPNGKMRVESVFNPSTTDEHEKSIVFDGERGTMKVSGGPQSPFAQRIADQIQFWVRDKGCIPGFLAALTLEFYDEMHNKTPPASS